MYKKTMTYEDYNGEKRTEDFYFNLSKAEILEMQMETEGGFDAMITKIVQAQDLPSLIKIFKQLILKSYGEKSPDGKRFIKTKELSDNFSYTEAFSNLFMQLATDAEAASEFVNGIIPNGLRKEMESVPNNIIEVPTTSPSTEV